MSPEALTRMCTRLIDTGDPEIEILHAHTVKEDQRALLALSGTNPSRAEIARRLDRFYRRAASCSAPEAHRLAETIEAGWPAVTRTAERLRTAFLVSQQVDLVFLTCTA